MTVFVSRFILSPPLECKPHEDKDFSSSWMALQDLEQFLDTLSTPIR